MGPPPPANQAVSLYRNHRLDVHRKQFRNPRSWREGEINEIEII